MPDTKEVSPGQQAPTPKTISPPLKRFKVVKIAIIVLAVILIIGGPASFFIYEQHSFDNTYNAVETQVQLCLNNALKNAVLRTGVHGGRSAISDIAYKKQLEYDAEYLFFNGISRVPTQSQLSSEIATYTRQQLNDCVQQVSGGDITITAGDGPVDVTLDNGVTATVSYPFTVQSKLFGRDIEGSSARIDVDVTSILTPVRDIVDHVGLHKGIADLDIVKPADHTVTYVLYPEDDAIVFLVRSQTQRVDGISHAFLFAVDIHDE